MNRFAAPAQRRFLFILSTDFHILNPDFLNTILQKA